MRPRPHNPRTLVLLLTMLLLAATGCGGDGGEAGGSGGQAAKRAAGGDDRLKLDGVCPDPVVVQTSWFTQVEHFVAFQLLGEGYEPDAERKRVTGPLVADGVDTGVDIEIRAGGPAIGFQQVSAQMYVDQSITLGMIPVDEGIQNSAKQPVTAVMTPFDVDPLVLIWSPEEHPEWNTIMDIGQTDETVLFFEGERTYMDYLLGSGILRESQVDGSYQGTPDRFVASGGKIAVQGFATSEPYRWAHEVDAWNRPLTYQLVADTGYPNYRNALAVRAGEKGELAPCLERLVPILQQATVDFMQNPDQVIELVLGVVDETKQAYVDSVERSRHAVEVMRTDGLVSNGDNETVGEFDLERIRKLLAIDVPIYQGQGKELRKGLKPEDIATNEFVDESISLPAGAQ